MLVGNAARRRTIGLGPESLVSCFVDGGELEIKESERCLDWKRAPIGADRVIIVFYLPIIMLTYERTTVGRGWGEAVCWGGAGYR